MSMSPNIRWIRRLIWTYFWLLLFEGALRKWVVPSLSNPLLIVRTPVAIAIYWLAFQARIFPFNRWVLACVLLAFVSLFAGLYVLQDTPAVALFGFQADFLHLPLIFVIPCVFDREDVRRIGFWTLVMCLPMALLMVLQYQASPSAWINAGAGIGSSQIDAGGGHIRPAGTFSYILGPAFFFPLAATFLLTCQFLNMRYPRWLLVASTLSLLIGAAVSSSRTLAASVGIVLVCALVAGLFLQPVMASSRLLIRMLAACSVIGVAAFLVIQLPVFNKGLQTFNDRIQGSGKTEGGTQGFVNRGMRGFTEPLEFLADTPLLGRGLGMGTNAGSTLITGGQATYLLAEGEWTRVILESGPIVGGVYLLLRVLLGLWLGGMAVQASRHGNTLPFLIFACCLPPLLTGQFGQPTELGFAVFGAGLTLAAMRLPAAFPAATGQAADVAATQAIGQAA